MNVQTTICYARGRYSAHVVLDGDLTSWDCSHLHHSLRTAEKCERDLRNAAADFFAEAEVYEVDAMGGTVDPLYEGRRGPTSRRFARPYTRATPLTPYSEPLGV